MAKSQMEEEWSSHILRHVIMVRFPFPPFLTLMSDPTQTHGPVHESDLTRSNPGIPPTDGKHPTVTGGDGSTFASVLIPVAPPGYEILEELGRGGMGVVYKARQLKLNRLIALKMLRGVDLIEARDLLRFLAEAEAVAAVVHPHVVQVYEVGQHEGRPYMALEYLPGGTLADLLKRRKETGDGSGRLAPREAAELVARLAQAVQAAHDQGIVHRDLKPANILFGKDEAIRMKDETNTSSATPKVSDFGLAKRVTGTDLTKTQAVMGTPAYMPPEQARGDTKFVGPGADIYGLGVILYECLTGSRPFEGDDQWAVLRRVIDELPERPRNRTPNVPRDLELIALKCLEKNPTDRYPTAAALADDLMRFLNGQSVSIRPAGVGERFIKWSKRNPTVAGLLAALLVVGLLGFAGVTWGLLRAEARGDDLAKKNDELTTSKAETLATNQQLERIANNLTQSTKDLESANTEVTRRAAEAEDRGYLSDVALAHQLWKANDLRGMRAALERCPPSRRKWEWHYLNRLSQPMREVIPTDSLPVALAYSPDGKLLAFFTLGGTLTVRDIEKNKDRFRISGLQSVSRYCAIVFRPSGGEMLYSSGSSVRVLDLESGKSREVIPPVPKDGKSDPQQQYVAVGYTADGRVLAAVGNHNPGKPLSFLIQDQATGKPIATLIGPDPSQAILLDVSGAAFNADGSRFSAIINVLGIRASKTGEAPEKVAPFRPEIILWDIVESKQLRQVEAGSSLLGSVAFTPDGEATGFGRAGQAAEISLSATTPPRYFPGHVGEVSAIAFDRNGLIWSGGEDKLIIGHDRRSGIRRLSLPGCQDTIIRLAVSPDGKEIAAAAGSLTSGTGTVSRFDVSGSLRDTWQGVGGDRVNIVTAVSAETESVAICDFSLTINDANDHRLTIRNLPLCTDRILKSSFQWMRGALRPNGELVVNDMNNHFRILAPDGSKETTLILPKDWGRSHLSQVACSPDGKIIAGVKGYDHRTWATGQKPDLPRPLKVRLVTWNAATPESSESVEADLTAAIPADADFSMAMPVSMAIDAEGKLVAAVFTNVWANQQNQSKYSSSGVVVVWDLGTRKEVFHRQTEQPLRAVVFDKAGRLLVGGGTTDGRVVGWDLGSGNEVLSLRGHTRPIQALAIGPDGRLATGGIDRVVKLWEISSGHELLTLDGFSREVTHLAFSQDGKTLIVATGPDWVSLLTTVGSVPTEWVPSEVKIFRGPK